MQAFNRMGCKAADNKTHITFDPRALPREIAQCLDVKINKLVFDMQRPPDSALVSRNHVLVRTLAEYILAKAMKSNGNELLAARCGVIRTSSVPSVTTLLVLRARFLIESKTSAEPLLAEECILAGFTGIPPSETWLHPEEAETLFDSATPSGNLTAADKQEWLKKILAHVEHITSKTKALLDERSRQLQESHERQRKTIKMRRIAVRPLFPPDLVSISLLLPTPRG